MGTRKILAVCLDCGDTLVDEETEVKDEQGVSLSAKLIPSARELVLELKARAYPLALVADGACETFVNNLGPYGLSTQFDAYAISEEIGVTKPDAKMFHHALSRLGVAEANYGCVVMLGNNLARDIQGANALGLISVWLDWSPRRSKTPANALQVPKHTIRFPIELLQLLTQFEQPS